MGLFGEPKKYKEHKYRIKEEQNYEFLQTISRLPFVRAKIKFSNSTRDPVLVPSYDFMITYLKNEDSFVSELYHECKDKIGCSQKKLLISKEDINSETEISIKHIINATELFCSFDIGLHYPLNYLENEVVPKQEESILEETFFPQFMNKDLNVFKDLGLYINEIFVEWADGFISVKDRCHVKHKLINKKYIAHNLKKVEKAFGKNSRTYEHYEKVADLYKRQDLLKLFRELIRDFNPSTRKKIDEATNKILDKILK